MSGRIRGCVAAAKIALVILLLDGSHAQAQVASDYQQWVALNSEISLREVTPGLRLFFNAESRSLNQPRRDASVTDDGVEEQNPNTILLVRPAIGYTLQPWITVWLGYAWQPIYYRSAVREDVQEHRVFQQLSGAWNWGRWQLGYRTRLEQRYRATGDAGEIAQGEGQWAHRLRQQLRGSLSLGEASPWQLIAYDEIFIHLNRTRYPTQGGLDQNRLFVGLGYQAGTEVRLEVGYLNQFVRRFTDRHQLNHVLWLNVVVLLNTTRESEAHGPLDEPS